MLPDIDSSWKTLLTDELEKPYFKSLTAFISSEYERHRCYPKKGEIFAAFTHCPFEETKVVIIGQDPYHGPHQANGLCFSVHDGIKHPPSLVNIFKELQTDCNKPYPKSGNLEKWAKPQVSFRNFWLPN